jgi:hypothetical protein
MKEIPMDRAVLHRTRSIAAPSTRLAVGVLVCVLAVAGTTTWWHASRHDWSSLSASERETLAPLVYYWQDIPPEERLYYRELAADPALASPADRAIVSRNLELWHLMTPAERREARAAFMRFRTLSPEQRRTLIERWEAEQAAMSDETPAAEEGVGEEAEAPAAEAAAASPTNEAAGTAADAPAEPPAEAAPGTPTDKAVIKDAPQPAEGARPAERPSGAASNGAPSRPQ